MKSKKDNDAKLTKSRLMELIRKELQALYEWPESDLYKGEEEYPLEDDEDEESEIVEEIKNETNKN